MKDIIIIGAGIFGCLIKDTLHAEGIPSKLIDCCKPLAGSNPAGCLIKPSWLSSLSKDDLKRSLTHLDYLYGLETIRFNLGLDIHHVNPLKIVSGPDIAREVTHVNPKHGVVTLNGGEELEGIIIVAAGIWSKVLLPTHFMNVKLQGMRGVSLRFGGRILPKLQVWAPYKQSIGFNISNSQVWFGDGTSIKEEKWKSMYKDRAIKHAGMLDGSLTEHNLIQVREGVRPYVPKQAGWCKQVGPYCWVSTGGGKNGVALASLQALNITEEIKTLF